VLVTRAVLAALDLIGVVTLGVMLMRSPLWTGDRRDRAVVGLAFCTGLLTLNSAAVNGLRWALPPWLRLIELAVIVVIVVGLNVSFLRERRELRRRLLAQKQHKIERNGP
jgi:hypothetical protein